MHIKQPVCIKLSHWYLNIHMWRPLHYQYLRFRSLEQQVKLSLSLSMSLCSISLHPYRQFSVIDDTNLLVEEEVNAGDEHALEGVEKVRGERPHGERDPRTAQRVGPQMR